MLVHEGRVKQNNPLEMLQLGHMPHHAIKIVRGEHHQPAVPEFASRHDVFLQDATQFFNGLSGALLRHVLIIGTSHRPIGYDQQSNDRNESRHHDDSAYYCGHYVNLAAF